MEKEEIAMDLLERIEVFEIIDSDYPYRPIEAIRTANFDFPDEKTLKNIRKLFLLKFLLYSPLKCMYILKTLAEQEEFQKISYIINELKKRKIIIKKMNQSEFKNKYLENLVYFGFLEAKGRGKKRKYRISSEFETLKYEIPSVLMWLIGNECSPIDQIWYFSGIYSQKFGEITCLSQNGEESEDFDILKIVYSLMSCGASNEETRRILKKMEDDRILHVGMSKNQVVYGLIQVAHDLGFQDIEREMAKKAPEFLGIVYVDDHKQEPLDSSVVKRVIENYVLEMNMVISKKFSKELSRDVLSFLINDVARKKLTEVRKSQILNGMNFMLYEKLDIKVEDRREISGKILDSIIHIVEDPRRDELPFSLIVPKISFYLLIKNGLIVLEKDASQEMINDLSMNMPSEAATEYKRVRKDIISSMKQEIKSYLGNIQDFVDLLKFSIAYTGDDQAYKKELVSRHREVLEKLINAIVHNR